MKKIWSLTLALLLVVALVSAGCSGTDEGTGSEEGAAVSLGLGVINSIAKSKSYSKGDDGSETLPLGQVDTVMAAALFDEDGRVVDVIIDTAQTKVNFNQDFQVTSDLSAPGKTKAELGPEYGMAPVSGIGKEWNEQIAELEKWMVGKTVEEIKALPVKQRDEAHPAVPDDPELSSLVTITVHEYIEAVEKAYNNRVDVENAVKLGLGHNISIAKSKGYSKDEASGTETLPLAQVDTVMAATAFDGDGKVAGVIIDTAQVKVNFDAEGQVTSDLSDHPKTKAELGPDYGMGRVSEIGKEWNEQIAELEKWMVGKTVEEIKALPVKQRDEAHPAVPDDPELSSLVTMTVQDYLAAVEEAFANTR
ncbi:MAG TPA: hypothetical protein PLY40_01735 [Bacillota bacterium]|nr:hypothetical protein [Bacillota bacterium]